MNEVYMKKDGEFKPLMLAIGDGEHYSTTEQRIGTWIDGKPLYRKTIAYTTTSTVGALNTATSVSIPHNISNFKQLVRAEATDSINLHYPLMNGTNTVSNATFIHSANDTYVYLKIINDTFTARTYYITLEYTKTTD